MTIKYATILLTIILLLIVAVPSGARDLTLRQALDLALEHSLELKKQAALLNASRSALSASKAERMPMLSAEVMGSYRDEVASLTLAPSPGVTINRELGTKDVFQSDLRLSLPLYTGGRLSAAVNMAHADNNVREALMRSSRDEVLLTAQVEYLSLFLADTLLASAQAALDRVQIVHNDITLMYHAGVADSVDLLEAQLALAEANLAVDEATTLRRQSEIRLNVLLGLDAGEPLILTQALAAPRLGDVKMAPVPSDKAELLVASHTSRRIKEERNLAKSRLMPSLTAFGGYSYGKPNQDMFNKTWNDYFIAGAKLSWSLNLGFADKKRVEAATARVQAAEIEHDRIAEQLDREANLAYESLQLAYQQYQTARERKRITTDNFRLARMRQQEGTIPTNRLLEIEKSLTQAEAAVAVSLAQFYIARAAYLYATGSDELKRGVL